jgi:hypothetical protein
MNHEFYDQSKWLELHKEADELVATRDGTIIKAVYFSPQKRHWDDILPVGNCREHDEQI